MAHVKDSCQATARRQWLNHNIVNIVINDMACTFMIKLKSIMSDGIENTERP